MTSPPNTAALLAALLAAIEPIAAYCARTPAPNVHADRCAALVNAAADYVEAVEQQAAGPDWQAIAHRLLTRCPLPASTPSPWSAFAAQQLARPDFVARRALPLVQRMELATRNSHYLGLPNAL